VIDVLLASNEAHKNFLFQRATAELAPGGSVLLLGLAFKAGSDDLRESPKVHLARRLLDAGYALSIYDPALRPDRLVGQNLAYGFMELPELAELLVPRETAESRVFDIVIDASGLSGELDLASANVLNIAAFA
jgi:GDP-mannose 6-dehydrogenase